MFFPQYSTMMIPGQATHASHTTLKGFHVVVLTLTSDCDSLLPSSTVLHKQKTLREEGESDKDGHALMFPNKSPFSWES